jgi:hypothetical protein
MLDIDYQKHNEAVAVLLAEEKTGSHPRVPMKISANPRMILSDPLHNPEKIDFKTYMEDPEIMLTIQGRFQEYSADDLIWDKIMGFGNYPGLAVYADVQNVSEAEWFGCPVAYHGIYEPGTRTCLADSGKYDFIGKPFPEFQQGVMGRAMDFTAYFEEQRRKGYEYRGKPISEVNKTGLSTDGPFTIGCCLLGATELCLALYEEPDFVRDFLAYITDATIARIRYLRRHYGLPERSENLFFADDSIAMLSIDDYTKHVFPFHKKLIEELTDSGRDNSVHLCGNATHLFVILKDELRVNSFDTGFPVRFGELLRRLGPETAVSGGVHVDILLKGDREAIRVETRRILEEVKPLSRRFTIKEANNLSPGTKPVSLLAMYRAVEEFGYY